MLKPTSKPRAPHSRFPCPTCGSRKTIPIVYGMPAPPLFEDEERGRVKLGGCLVDDDNPDRHCNACGHDWLRRALTLDEGAPG